VGSVESLRDGCRGTELRFWKGVYLDVGDARRVDCGCKRVVALRLVEEYWWMTLGSFRDPEGPLRIDEGLMNCRTAIGRLQ
jgi:hypothetical protein